MIGRALRGPKVGGTDSANIVLFTDNWKHLITWAGYEQLAAEGALPPTSTKINTRRDTILIPIELVQYLTAELLSAKTDELHQIADYSTLLPIGWYAAQYVTTKMIQEDDSVDEGEEGSDTKRPFVLVFDNEQACYAQFFNAFSENRLTDLDLFEDDTLTLETLPPDLQNVLDRWLLQYFEEVSERSHHDWVANLFHLARHLAENGEMPRYFDFDARKDHDLDKLVKQAIDEDWTLSRIARFLDNEYRREDRYWNKVYSSAAMLRQQFDLRRGVLESGLNSESPQPEGVRYETPMLDPTLVNAVKRRDNYRCLCCGEDNPRWLQIDHVTSRYYGGNDTLENLQTLCKRCNLHKDIVEADFRSTTITKKIERGTLKLPKLSDEDNTAHRWERSLFRAINYHYGCAAIESFRITNSKGDYAHWHITLHEGNEPRWVAKNDLRILLACFQEKNPRLKGISIHAPKYRDLTVGEG
jgi:hypothetical protein